jgi:TusE/DsrC/DsvC family sulfur relay protein
MPSASITAPARIPVAGHQQDQAEAKQYRRITMDNATQNYVRPGYESHPDARFPNAPAEWSPENAKQAAQEQGLALTEDHWEVVRSLQEFYARHEGPTINVRELHDALEEHFHHEGGLKHLYELFPKGPVTQGCQLAGLQPPAGAQDKGFGSAV